MTERLLHTGGVQLCLETFGSPADPAVLLVAGGAQSMVWWENAFCERLAAAGRFVVRYDHRDTGRSTSSPAGRPSYTGADLATDRWGSSTVWSWPPPTSWACPWVGEWPSGSPCRRPTVSAA